MELPIVSAEPLCALHECASSRTSNNMGSGDSDRGKTACCIGPPFSDGSSLDNASVPIRILTSSKPVTIAPLMNGPRVLISVRRKWHVIMSPSCGKGRLLILLLFPILSFSLHDWKCTRTGRDGASPTQSRRPSNFLLLASRKCSSDKGSATLRFF